MNPQCHRLAVSVAMVVLLLTVSGCGKDRALEDLESAQQSVQVALDTWKRGEQVATLKSAPKPIEFFDDDWQRSARLLEYKVVNSYTETDGTPRCAVDLTVQYGGKSAQQVQVTYQVVHKDNGFAIARNPF